MQGTLKRVSLLVLAFLMALGLAVSFCGMNAYAADSIEVYFSVSDQGVLAQDNDGQAMSWREVTVQDLDENGQYTYDEALVAAHKAYNAEDGYNQASGTVKKLWGTETTNTLFYINGVGLTSGVTVDTVSEGDYLLASLNKDQVYYADWTASFDEYDAEVELGESLTLTLKGHLGMAYTDEEKQDVPLKDIQVGIWKDGAFQAIDGAVTDADGKVTISFSEPGDHVVTAQGEVNGAVASDYNLMNYKTMDYTVDGTAFVKYDFDTLDTYVAYTEEDYGDGPYPAAKIKYMSMYDEDGEENPWQDLHYLKSNQVTTSAPIMAPACNVTTIEVAPETSVTVKAAVRNFEKANKFDILPQEIAVSSTTAEKYGDYGDIIAGNNGKVTVADLMYTLHEKKFDEVSVDNIADYFVMSSDGWIQKYFKIESSAQIYYTNNNLAMADTPYQRVLSDGDAYDQFLYQDSTGYSDVASAFAETEKSGVIGERLELDLLRVNWDGTTSPLTKAAEGTVTAALVDENGELTPIDGAEMDENGKITLSFDKPGTYLVSASGKAAGEWGDGVISAPYCTVTVSADIAPETSVTVKAAVRNFEKADKFDILPKEIAVSSTTAEKYGDYGDIIAGNNGKVTIADLLYTLHEKKYNDFSVETKDNYLDMSGGWITKCFGETTSNVVYIPNRNLLMAGSTYETALVDGDPLDLYMCRDGWNDVPTAYAESEMTVTAGEPFELALIRMNWDATTSALQKVDGETVTAAIVDENGELTPIDGAEMDENGKISLSFDKPGTYLVSACGKAVAEYAPSASIVAPYCTVTVTAAEDITPPAPIAPAAKVVKGTTYKKSGQSFKVTKVASGSTAGTVTFTKAKNAKNVTVPATVKLADKKTYKVTVVAAKAFTGKKIRTVTIGKNVTKIKAKAFAKSKATKLIIKTKKLKKASVKGSLKGSKVKTIKVKCGKKYVKKYKKIFTKKNAGKKVTVK